jgi:hypothetical protein
MKRIDLRDTATFAPHLCQRCGGLMRLIGSEPNRPKRVPISSLTAARLARSLLYSRAQIPAGR